MTRPYVEALEARGIAHLLVGGRSFHNRAEIETLRAALAAIEWPEDELRYLRRCAARCSRSATKRCWNIAIGSAIFIRLEFPRNFPTNLAPIVEALKLLRALHRARNRVPVATTIASLLESTRAHVGFALEHGGEQVLANVSHVAELARRYEAEGGISFRGFIDELDSRPRAARPGKRRSSRKAATACG